MNCEITVTPDFLREMKRLSKRYRSIKDDIRKLGDEIKANPTTGVDLGRGLRKVRMAISSKGKGKSGGARVITFVVVVTASDTEVKLLTIYDKSERTSISDSELLDMLKRNGLL